MNNNLDGLDIISLFGTFLGILNYQENLSQSDFQKATENQTIDIHEHLLLQDEKNKQNFRVIGGEKQ